EQDWSRHDRHADISASLETDSAALRISRNDLSSGCLLIHCLLDRGGERFHVDLLSGLFPDLRGRAQSEAGADRCCWHCSCCLHTYFFVASLPNGCRKKLSCQSLQFCNDSTPSAEADSRSSFRGC